MTRNHDRIGHVLGVLCGLLLAAAARAGGGPETTLLVVNAGSALSLAVANEYIRLRDLPERHVVWLDDVPPLDTMDVETFRTRILAPVRRHLAVHGLEQEIDLIAYSAGFPYAVDFRSDEREHGLERNPHRGNAGSLTGMTFFARQIEARQIGYLGLRANHYFRRPSGPLRVAQDARPLAGPDTIPNFEPARSFRSRYHWDLERGAAGAEPSADHRYFLSAMLAYTGVRGNSLPEVTAYLRRAAASDASHPHGTVYLMGNRDIRTRVRRHLFRGTIAALEARGRRAVVLSADMPGENGREPQRRTDVIGLVAGTRRVLWEQSGSVLLPGAIAESFTSFAGHFANPAQTKLSEFLRHGAAGSSGAVREPYSFVEKFPVPQMHVFYADGASLVEAYYQSVSAPYQLLIVGDPLARPFARFGEIALVEPDAGVSWRGVVDVRPSVIAPAGRGVERIELWVNGRRVAAAPATGAIRLDTTRLPDGVQDLRLVAVEAGPLETRYFAGWPIRIDNHGRQVLVEGATRHVPHGDAVELSGRAEGARRVVVRHGTRMLAEAVVRGGHWRVQVPSSALGMGSVALQVVAEYADGGAARAAPVRLTVGPPARLIAAGLAPPGEGVQLQVERARDGAVQQAVVPAVGPTLPKELRGGRMRKIAYSGAFEARMSGLYELTLEAEGDVELTIGSALRHAAAIPAGAGGMRLALPLEAGWHRFTLSVADPSGERVRAILAGPEEAFELAAQRVRH
ncbi:MAG TPA: hypothetical protein PL143_00180 [Rhodocyclaceae bacterium]|nr:hypothetical protein [Rhodocyclaceae bacterium]